MRYSMLFGFLLLFASISARAGDPAKPPVKIVTLGDSITRGVRSGVTADETFSALLQKQLGDRAIKAEVVNRGIGGERTDQALKRLAKDVLALKPAVVVVMYGTNDSYVDKGQKQPRLSVAEYRANLESLVAELRKANIRPILMTPPRWGDKAVNGAGENPNVRLEKYVEACREVAVMTKTPLADHFAYWTKRAKNGGDVRDWTTDQCHPNPRGHREITDVLLPAVLPLVRPEKKGP
jgi:lysophospholipase L1-like esterase